MPPVPPPSIGSRIGRWTVQFDAGNQTIYYWDPVKRASVWEKPAAPAPPPPGAPPPLPDSAWVEVMDDISSRHYYWNEETGVVQWTRP